MKRNLWVSKILMGEITIEIPPKVADTAFCSRGGPRGRVSPIRARPVIAGSGGTGAGSSPQRDEDREKLSAQVRFSNRRRRRFIETC